MNDWEEAILAPEDNMEKAIQVLNAKSLKIVLITNKNGQLLGTITDGDIRRALINKLGMNTRLKDIMSKKPSVAFIEEERGNILTMMKNKKLQQVPILDADKKVVGLETLLNLLSIGQCDNPVFLVAGGFGKRLRPLTDKVPKPLLSVGSKPILETIIYQLIEGGFHNFFISTHYKAEMVKQYFGDGSKWGVSIQYVQENKPLGTAGSLGLLPKNKIKIPFIMMNADLLTNINFRTLLEYHNEQKSFATMCVREYTYQVPFGVVEIEKEFVTSIVEKPVQNFFVNAGIYVFEPKLIVEVDGKNYLDMPKLLEKLIKNGNKISTFPIHEYWLDIGHKEEYEIACEHYAKKSEFFKD